VKICTKPAFENKSFLNFKARCKYSKHYALKGYSMVYQTVGRNLMRRDRQALKVRGNKVKPCLQQAVEPHSVVRRRGSHIFQTISSQMAVRLSGLRAGRTLPRGRFLVLISLRS
jgi:hypothetical protein